jgi:hypothetical protein
MLYLRITSDGPGREVDPRCQPRATTGRTARAPHHRRVEQLGYAQSHHHTALSALLLSTALDRCRDLLSLAPRGVKRTH